MHIVICCTFNYTTSFNLNPIRLRTLYSCPVTLPPSLPLSISIHFDSICPISLLRLHARIKIPFQSLNMTLPHNSRRCLIECTLIRINSFIIIINVIIWLSGMVIPALPFCERVMTSYAIRIKLKNFYLTPLNGLELSSVPSKTKWPLESITQWLCHQREWRFLKPRHAKSWMAVVFQGATLILHKRITKSYTYML